MDIGGALPKNAEWRVKKLKNIIKQTINLVPTSGQVQVDAGSRIYIDLPVDTTIDLSTFVMYYNGWTDTGALPAAGEANYCTARFFPRNTQSIIQNLEIQINGRTIANLPEYNYIYNILHDYTAGSQNQAIKNIGENADPSNKFWNNAGVITPRRGYPIGLVAAANNSATGNDYDYYCIRNWLSIFDGSTKIINTGAFGIITLIITLAPNSITMLGAANSGTTPAAITAANSDIGIATAGSAGNNGALVPALGSGYHINNVAFSIVRYNFPPEFYQAQANTLSQGGYKLYFPNYNYYTGNPVNDSTQKGTTMRMSLTTKSLDFVLGTFRAANYNDNGAVAPSNNVVNGNVNRAVFSDLTQSSKGISSATFDNLKNNGQPIIFNNSKYFVRNGEGILNGTFTIGNTRLNTEVPQEMFESILRHFNVQNDTVSGLHPSIQNLNQFTKYAFAHILSLNVGGEDRHPYPITGMDTDDVPINIQWQTIAGGNVANDNVWGIINNGQSAMPVLIAFYTSCLHITGNRNVEIIP